MPHQPKLIALNMEQSPTLYPENVSTLPWPAARQEEKKNLLTPKCSFRQESTKKMRYWHIHNSFTSGLNRKER